MRRNEDEKASDHRRSPLSGTGPDTRRKKQRAAGSGGMLSVHFAVCVNNCPDIEDVRTALRDSGEPRLQNAPGGGARSVDASGLSKFCVEKRLAGKMRSSILFLGALQQRCGKAELALPGGCPLGETANRSALKSLAKLGARFRFEKGILQAAWRERRMEIFFCRSQALARRKICFWPAHWEVEPSRFTAQRESRKSPT